MEKDLASVRLPRMTCADLVSGYVSQKPQTTFQCGPIVDAEVFRHLLGNLKETVNLGIDPLAKEFELFDTTTKVSEIIGNTVVALD
jgi:hypothetical protein